jgi:hypothetical protein
MRELILTCPNCASWFAKADSRIDSSLARYKTRSGEDSVREVYYCPHHGKEKVVLLDAHEQGIQTPYGEAMCELIQEEIDHLESRLRTLRNKLIDHLG